MARQSGFLTEEIKEELKKVDIEHTLLIDEAGALELCRWEQIPTADERIAAFLFERKGKVIVACRNNAGDGRLSLPLGEEKTCYPDELGGEEITIEMNGNEMILPLGKKRYFITTLKKESLADAFAKAKLL